MTVIILVINWKETFPQGTIFCYQLVTLDTSACIKMRFSACTNTASETKTNNNEITMLSFVVCSRLQSVLKSARIKRTA